MTIIKHTNKIKSKHKGAGIINQMNIFKTNYTLSRSMYYYRMRDVRKMLAFGVN